MNSILKQHTNIRIRRELFIPTVTPVLNNLIWELQPAVNDNLFMLVGSEWKMYDSLHLLIGGVWRNVVGIEIINNGTWHIVIS